MSQTPCRGNCCELLSLFSSLTEQQRLKSSGGSPSEGHNPLEALRGNLSLRGLCGGLSEGSAGSLRGFCRVSAGFCGVSAGFSEGFWG